MTMILVTTNRAASVSFLQEEVNPESTFSKGAAFINRIKRAAKKANPRFRPFKMENETEWFILFADKKEFEELKNDPNISLANTNSRHDLNSPPFESFDLLYNGFIIREITDDPF
jgi:hypothetical protein